MILSQSLSPLSLFFFTSVFRRIPILFKLVPWPKQTHIHNQPSQPTPTPPHTSLRISQISILHDRGKPETHPGNEREDISGEKKRNRCDHCHCIDGESEYSPLTPRLLRFPIPYGSRSLLVFSLPCLSPFLSLNLVFSLFSSFRHCDAQSLHPPRSRVSEASHPALNVAATTVTNCTTLPSRDSARRQTSATDDHKTTRVSTRRRAEQH